MAASIPRVDIKGLRKVFGRHPALSGVSCSLLPGRIHLVMGPNGAGKSTLLAILSTLSRPTGGEVRYGEHSHAYAERHLRGRIGLLSHEAMLYRHMTCRENLHFFARLNRVADARQQVDRWLERVQLSAEADRPTAELSRGMQQRAALARVLMPEPHLLLLDEPFTGLDSASVSLLRQELCAARQAGRIVVLVSHDIAAVDGLCDVLLVLARGRLKLDHEESALGQERIRLLGDGVL